MVAKLEAVTKEDMIRKSKGFFGFGKDKSEADVENIKATVMLCYGYVTFSLTTTVSLLAGQPSI